MSSKLRFRFILIYTLLIFGVIFALGYRIKPAPPKNILLISIDTLRPDHMGLYGYSKNTTPNIDSLAREGLTFTNVLTTVPMTYPSFASLMTGKSPFALKIYSNQGIPISSNVKTMATILKEEGYTTAAYVSMRATALKQGFEEVNYHQFKTFHYGEDKTQGKEIYSQTDRQDYEKFILSSADWIKDNKEKIFFMWVHLMDVHQPFYPPEDLRCSFNNDFCQDIMGKTQEELEKLRTDYQSCQEEPVPQKRVEIVNTLYDGGVAAADRLVGKIINELKSEGIDKNTLIIIYGDHGDGADHNYYFNHRAALYDSSIRIPLIIIDPWRKATGKSETLINNTDILPTIFDLLGIPYKDFDFDGKSFASHFNPFLKIFTSNPRNSSVSVNNEVNKFSITEAGYKYIYSLPSSCVYNNQPEELYDLGADPNEITNLVSQKPDMVSGYKEKLLKYLSNFNLPQYIEGESSKAGTMIPLKFLGY